MELYGRRTLSSLATSLGLSFRKQHRSVLFFLGVVLHITEDIAATANNRGKERGKERGGEGHAAKPRSR